MAKRTAKGKGKRAITTLRGEDGRFLPSPPDPPGSTSQSAPGPQPPPEHEVSGTPMHPGGLGYPESSSSEKFYAANLRPEADQQLEEERERAPPSSDPPPLGSAPRSLSGGIPVTIPYHAPVTVETVTDEDVAARRRSHAEVTSSEIGGRIHVDQVTSFSEIITKSAPTSVNTRDRPPSGALVLREIAPEARSPGSADVENLLNETCASTGTSRSARDRAPSSIERELRECTEIADKQTQTAMDLNHRALGLLMESMESTKQARAQAIRAQQRVEDLLSVSSRHREHVRSIQRTENDSSTTRIIREASDEHRKQADYERRLKSNVLTTEERLDIKPSPIDSMLLESRNASTSLSRNADGNRSSQGIRVSLSIPRQTPPRSPEPRNPGRMDVEEWVQYTQRQPPPPAEGHGFVGANTGGERRGRSPPAGNGYPGTNGNRNNDPQPPMRQSGFIRDLPPHLSGGRYGGAAGGAGGGPNDPGSSSSSSTEGPRRRRSVTPRPRRRRRAVSSSSSSSRGDRSSTSTSQGNVPEYMRTRRSHTFEPLAPGARIYNDQQDRNRDRGHRRDYSPFARARSPLRGRPGPQVPPQAPQPRVPGPDRPRAGRPNDHLRADHGDKVVNMLRSSFIDDATAAGRMGHTIPVHKLGIKTGLPKCYEGEPDPTVFENWLSLLLGFFRIHQLDVLNEGQDRTRLEILGQALKGKAHTYFRERMGQFLEQGANWDFREAVLDLKDRYLYKSTPFTAAQLFDTIKQGNKDTQALYDELTTQAARMIEYPSDYQFRFRFMLALRSEIMDHIIKNHRISAEHSTIAEIRAACEDFERSQEYGKQLSALQSRNNARHTSTYSKAPQHSNSSSHRRPPHRSGNTNDRTNTTQSQPRPAGKETEPIKHSDNRARTSRDPKGKFIPRSTPREGASKDKCYNCGKSGHFSRNCPDPPKAKGYAARLEEDDEAVLEEVLDASEHGSTHSQDEEVITPDEPDIALEDDVGCLDDHCSSEYGDNRYQFSDEGTSIIGSRAMRVIPLEAEDEVNARVARASKPGISKPQVVESNRARYKVGAGPQPSRNKRLQRCIEVSVPVNGLVARVLLDGGSNTNMVSPEFATVAKIPAIELQEQMTLQLAVTGSRSKINYGAWAQVKLGSINPKVYFDIANIDGYDVILGTPFMWEHAISPIFEGDGWIMKDGQRLDISCATVESSFRPKPFRPKSFRPSGQITHQ